MKDKTEKAARDQRRAIKQQKLDALAVDVADLRNRMLATEQRVLNLEHPRREDGQPEVVAAGNG